MPSDLKSKRCPGCCNDRQKLPIARFHKRADAADGFESKCKACRSARSAATRAAKADDAASSIVDSVRDRARRLASDHEPLKPEDFEDEDEYDASVANVNTPAARRTSAQAAKEKRQEFSASMGRNADALRAAATTAHQRSGDVLSAMPGESGTYIGKLAEAERRFQNRRLARTISLAQANEALTLQAYKHVAKQYFADKIAAVGCAKKAPSKPAKRTVVLLLSDLHLGAQLESLDEPMPFLAIQEARRLEYVMRQAIDYKPQYRAHTHLIVAVNGDIIEGQLGHQIGAGSPLAEQKAIAWTYLRTMIAELSAVYPSVHVEWQPGNHGRDKMRHPGRATWRKWDGHEWEIGWALREMCSGLKNTTWGNPFRAVSALKVHGSVIGMTHGDTEIKLAHPDQVAKNNQQLDRINAVGLFHERFDAWLFGHFHSGRALYGETTKLFNGALIPPNGHARASGYIGEAMGQFLFEAVEGFPVGDVRFIRVGCAQDNDASLGKIIKPFRFDL